MSELKVDKVSPRSGNYVSLNTVGMKNIIINGDMSIAQRGTTATGLGNGDGGYHTVDRWRFTESGSPTAEFTMSQDTDVPTGQGFTTSLKMDCTTAQGSLAAGDLFFVEQRFEGQNLQYLKKGTSNAISLTLSFWVKSNKTGTYVCELYDDDNTRTINKSFTVSSSNTWEKKTITYDGDTTGAFSNDNGNSLGVDFWLGAGSNFTSGTLQTSWGARVQANRAVGQVNLADSTSNYINITGVQLEAGTTASDFEFLPYDVNLARCQRYYYKIIDVPGGDANGYFATGYLYSSNRLYFWIPLGIQMRASPSLYSTLSSTGKFRANTNIDRDTNNNPSLGNASGSIVNLNFDGWSGFTTGYAAAIRRYTATGVLGFNAEL